MLRTQSKYEPTDVPGLRPGLASGGPRTGFLIRYFQLMKLDRSKSFLARTVGPLLASSGMYIEVGLEVRRHDPSRVRFFLEIANSKSDEAPPPSLDRIDSDVQCESLETSPSQT